MTGSQKALALPSGASVFVFSPAALAKAATADDRGQYFDFVAFQQNAQQNMTPTTPSIAHMYALSAKLEEIFAEGLDSRFERHRQTNQMVRDWARQHGFTLFPERGFESITLTCINNGAKPAGRVVDVPKLVESVKRRGMLIDGGYGRIKGTTFRVSNMGDETIATMRTLLAAMDEAVAEQ